MKKSQGLGWLKPIHPESLFPQHLPKPKLEGKFRKLLEVIGKLQINIPFLDSTFEMPSYAKFLKDILSNKWKL